MASDPVVAAAKRRLQRARKTIRALHDGASRTQTSFRKQLLEVCRMARKIDRNLDFATAFSHLCAKSDLNRPRAGTARFIRLVEFLELATSDAARTRHAVVAELSITLGWRWRKFKGKLMKDGPSKLLAEARALSKLSWRWRSGELRPRVTVPYNPLANLGRRDINER